MSENACPNTDRATWRFDHINVVASAHPACLAFFREVMGLQSGHRPWFGFPGDWLYQGEQSFIHAMTPPQADPAQASMHLHHVAFRSDEPASQVLERVRATELPHTVTVVPGGATQQIFVTLPGGLMIELDTPLDADIPLDHSYRPGEVSFGKT